MNKKFLKRVVAFAMAATMVVGNGAIALADTAVSADGDGYFEGVEPDTPDLAAITLPTAAAGLYEYVADPNGLIRKYGDSTITAKLPAAGDDTGIYFTASDGKFSADSQELEVENINYCDIDLTVDIALTGGSDTIKFASGSAWGTDNKENEMYLAAVEKHRC